MRIQPTATLSTLSIMSRAEIARELANAHKGWHVVISYVRKSTGEKIIGDVGIVTDFASTLQGIEVMATKGTIKPGSLFHPEDMPFGIMAKVSDPSCLYLRMAKQSRGKKGQFEKGSYKTPALESITYLKITPPRNGRGKV